ncbi:MAG: dienelactone hydrolase family protein [Actinomycetota bacterium]|nr:dienelactone hydrolase family protein [Actinomycetota bacterium]
MNGTVTIGEGDSQVTAQLTFPEGGGGPGVVVVHDWFGLLPHVGRRCEELAAAGFVALAVDLYDGRTTTDTAKARVWLDGLNRDRALRQLRAAVAHLRDHAAVTPDRVGLLGYSMGGELALLMATQVDLEAVVGYYAILSDDDFAPLRAPALVHLAEHDDWGAPDAPQKFFAAVANAGGGVEHPAHRGTEHSFANADVPATYAAQADHDAWAATVNFFGRHLQ